MQTLQLTTHAQLTARAQKAFPASILLPACECFCAAEFRLTAASCMINTDRSLHTGAAALVFIAHSRKQTHANTSARNDDVIETVTGSTVNPPHRRRQSALQAERLKQWFQTDCQTRSGV